MSKTCVAKSKFISGLVCSSFSVSINSGVGIVVSEVVIGSEVVVGSKVEIGSEVVLVGSEVVIGSEVVHGSVFICFATCL